MLELMYRITGKNLYHERISRRNCHFKAEETKTYTVGERAMKEIRACKNIQLKNVVYICPICGHESKTRHGLMTHIYKMHPGEKYKYKGKK
jgi:hypothetical protein